MNMPLPASLPPLAKLFAAAYDPQTGGYFVPPRHLMTQAFGVGDIEAWRQQFAKQPMYDSVELEVATMLHSLVRLTGARSILETGCSRGFSTSFLAAGVVDNGGGKVTTVDVERCFHLWEGSELEPVVDFVQSSSAALEEKFKGEQFDMLFLDSLHTYSHLLIEMMLFDRHLKVGGVIVLHDTLFFDCLGPVAFQLVNNPRFETVTLPTPRKHGFPSRCPGMTIATKLSDDRDTYPFHLSQKYMGWKEQTIATGFGENRTLMSKSILHMLHDEKLRG